MSQVKYIFRDFWWTVTHLHGKKHSYASLMAKMYKLPRSAIMAEGSYGLLGRWEIDEKEFRNRFAKGVGLPIHEDSWTLFHKPVHLYATPSKSIMTFVKRLQKLGYPCVILSDDIKSQSQSARDLWRYTGFDDVLISCDIWIRKDDDVLYDTTKIFDYIIHRYGLHPSEILLVDDRADICLVAEKVWIKTVVATRPRKTIKDVKNILHI